MFKKKEKKTSKQFENEKITSYYINKIFELNVFFE